MTDSMPPPELPEAQPESVKERAREALEGSKQELKKVSARLVERADRLREDSVHKLNGLASSLERSAAAPEGEQGFEELARMAAQGLRKVSGVLERRRAEELLGEARDQIEQHPMATIGVAVALGFVGGRLLRR